MSQQANQLSGKLPEIHSLKAVILDMDGVITQTARTHSEAWKEMFDDFLQKQPGNHSPVTDEDYLQFIDGKPRYEGVRSFLESRNIVLPYGNTEDPPGNKTVCGLGNLKNKFFLDILEREGADTYDDAISKIKEWRSKKLKIAVVSSSKNCRKVLETAGISDLFDARIDGITLQEKGIEGKPAPDMFLEAARALDSDPESSVVFEDAISGVQAGTRGNFALVVGVGRSGKKKSLSENGADLVVQSLDQIDLFNKVQIEPFFTRYAPSLFRFIADFEKLIENKKPALFLDYDGTLTPIVKQPEDALLPGEMRRVLKHFASIFPTAVISGRDMDDVKKMVGIDSIIYAGSHGFRISGPDGLYMEHEKSGAILPGLDRIEKTLRDGVAGSIEGIRIERKRYALAVHYRNAPEDVIPKVRKAVDSIIDNNPGFKKGGGKKIIEIKPDIDWHKGRALNWILGRLDLANRSDIVPIYIGDDITDEDAFMELSDKGIGILVGFHGKPTAARYTLKNVYQVQLFIEMLMKKTAGNE
jgi:trehalose 6-phosphate phosphatase